MVSYFLTPCSPMSECLPSGVTYCPPSDIGGNRLSKMFKRTRNFCGCPISVEFETRTFQETIQIFLPTEGIMVKDT